MTDDREELQDPEADYDRDVPEMGVPITKDDPATPTFDEATGGFRDVPDPELDALLAVAEDLPTDEEEFAAQPEPEARVTPDTP